MKTSNLSSLNQPYVKRIGLLFAGIFIVMEIFAKLTGAIEKIDLTLVNLYILVALSMAAFSKEKTDDERHQIIRYFSFKLTVRIIIAGLAIIYVMKYNVETIYIAIASLLTYLLIFHLADYFNPNFIFKEETKKNPNIIKMFVGIMIIIGISFLYSIIKSLLAS
jgi:hypothetical protein